MVAIGGFAMLTRERVGELDVHRGSGSSNV